MRPTLYSPKNQANRVWGCLTDEGYNLIEVVKLHIKQLAGTPKPPSDADVVEYLARTWVAVRRGRIGRSTHEANNTRSPEDNYLEQRGRELANERGEQ